MPTSQELLHDFGHENAADDIARSKSIFEEVFIKTRKIENFLSDTSNIFFPVGAKGTGKSLLLWRKALLTAEKSGVLYAPWMEQRVYRPSIDFAASVQWGSFHQLFDKKGKPQQELWIKLWEWALMRCILQVWLHDISRRDDSKSDIKKGITDLLNDDSEDNPYQIIANFLSLIESRQVEQHGRPVLPASNEIRNFVLKHSRHFPPTYIFIDNQDDFFEQNPEFWMASADGMVWAAEQVHRITNHRTHVFATLRPEVYWQIQKSSHFPMKVSEFFELEWPDDKLIELLKVRAAKLDPQLLRSPHLLDSNPLAAFFGEEFWNPLKAGLLFRHPGTDVEETVSSFLLRHTFRRPRELILLGNAILRSRLEPPGEKTPQEQLVEAVQKAATEQIARGYLAEVCKRWEYCDDSEDKLKSITTFITRYLKLDIVPIAEAELIQKQFAERLKRPVDRVHPFCALASFGLIGWPEALVGKGFVQQFASAGLENPEQALHKAKWLFVHPVFYGPQFAVKKNAEIIVGKGLPFSPPEKSEQHVDIDSCFVFHSKSDHGVANQIYAQLFTKGAAAFCCELKDGWNSQESVVNGLDQRKRFIVLCSSSLFSNDAALMALKQLKKKYYDKLCGVLIDDCLDVGYSSVLAQEIVAIMKSKIFFDFHNSEGDQTVNHSNCVKEYVHKYSIVRFS